MQQILSLEQVAESLIHNHIIKCIWLENKNSLFPTQGKLLAQWGQHISMVNFEIPVIMKSARVFRYFMIQLKKTQPTNNTKKEQQQQEKS